MRDKVPADDIEELSELSDFEEEFKKNTDLTYYEMMNPDEKILTLQNRAQQLQKRH